MALVHAVSLLWWALVGGVWDGPARLVVAGPAVFADAANVSDAAQLQLVRQGVFGRGAVVGRSGGVVLRAAVPRQTRWLWVRMSGGGLGWRACKPPGGSVHWRWPGLTDFGWVSFGAIPAHVAAVELVAPKQSEVSVDCLLWVAERAQQPVELPLQTAVVEPHWDRPGGKISPYLASVNVHGPVATFVESPRAWRQAFAELGVRMVRFQGIGSGWDVMRPETWKAEKLAGVKAAIRAAKQCGVRRFLLCFDGLKIPRDDGRGLLTESFADYAAACARLVSELGPVAGELWCEPFNEPDHPSMLKFLEAHGQNFKTIVALYAACAREMKRAGRVKVGGPALCWPSAWAVRELLERRDAPVDFISWHHYATGRADTPTDKLMAAVAPGGAYENGVRAIEKAARESNRAPALVLGEFHLNFQAWKPVDRRVAGPEAAAFAASLLSWLPRTSVQAAMILDARAVHYGLVGLAGSDGLARALGLVPLAARPDEPFVRPVGWVYRWYNALVAGRWVECTLPNAGRGDIGVLAWRDRRLRGAMVVNRRSSPKQVAVVCGGLANAPRGPARLRLISAAGPVVASIRDRAGVFELVMPPYAVAFVTWSTPPGETKG